jgi:hypothetical protein
MMESYQTWRTQAIDKTANGYVGGFNVFRHYSEPFTPDNKDIVTPNNDTPYSWAWLDLRAEPMVVSVPCRSERPLLRDAVDRPVHAKFCLYRRTLDRLRRRQLHVRGSEIGG